MSLSLSLFGLERTGTTVTQWLLQRNFRARVNDGSKAWTSGTPWGAADSAVIGYKQ